MKRALLMLLVLAACPDDRQQAGHYVDGYCEAFCAAGEKTEGCTACFDFDAGAAGGGETGTGGGTAGGAGGGTAGGAGGDTAGGAGGGTAGGAAGDGGALVLENLPATVAAFSCVPVTLSAPGAAADWDVDVVGVEVRFFADASCLSPVKLLRVARGQSSAYYLQSGYVGLNPLVLQVRDAGISLDAGFACYGQIVANPLSSALNCVRVGLNAVGPARFGPSVEGYFGPAGNVVFTFPDGGAPKLFLTKDCDGGPLPGVGMGLLSGGLQRLLSVDVSGQDELIIRGTNQTYLRPVSVDVSSTPLGLLDTGWACSTGARCASLQCGFDAGGCLCGQTGSSCGNGSGSACCTAVCQTATTGTCR